MGLPPSVHDPEAVRGLADEILSDARYQRPGKSIPDRVLDWFLEQIGSVLGSLVGSGAGTVIAWAVVLGVISLVIYLIVRYGRVGRLDRPAARSARVMVELTRTPAEWLTEADSLEAAGRWREALRCRHRALIGELVRQGAIPDRAGRTAREYVSDVEVARPAALEDFVAATDLFEGAWYGHLPTSREDCARFQQLSAGVLRERVRA